MNKKILTSQESQSGLILIEALVAILIFTIGVIALMGVQAVAIRNTADSKVRMDAEFFADQLLAEMVVDARAPGGTPSGTPFGTVNFQRLATRYSSPGGVGYQRWLARVTDVQNGGLPGAAAAPPTVVISNVSLASSTLVQVDVSVFWRLPKDAPGEPPRRIVTRSIINE
jgi:type IV pilus assembly protein PilV